jgi:hypothetical protein
MSIQMLTTPDVEKEQTPSGVQRIFQSRLFALCCGFLICLGIWKLPSSTTTQEPATPSEELIEPQPNPASFLGQFNGSVKSVEADGSVKITIGSSTSEYIRMQKQDSLARFWGLRILDTGAANRFLVGRVVNCKVINVLGPLPEVDCFMSPRNADGRSIVSKNLMRDYISVFDWLTDLGLAVQDCPNIYSAYHTFDDNNYIWYCADGIPKYRINLPDE